MKTTLLLAATLMLLVLSRIDAAEPVVRPGTTEEPSHPFGVKMQEEMGQFMDQQLKRMVQGMMEEQVRFLEQPENLARIARIARQYYEELKKAGFSDEEALRIISSTSLFPTVTSK